MRHLSLELIPLDENRDIPGSESSGGEKRR